MADKNFRLPQQKEVTAPVFSTRLNKSLLPQTCITKTAVIDELEKNLHLPLTPVSTPTGGGKRITISQWSK